MGTRIHRRALAAFVALTAAGHAQLASSAAYSLEDFDLCAVAGGMSSPQHAAFVDLVAVAGADMSSPQYLGAIGFLAAHDPEPTNAPVVFAVSPGSGAKAGGTPVAISGLNFQHPSAGANPTVAFGGAAIGALVVVSDTLITGIAPALSAGPADVVVTSALGSGTLPNGWVASPAVTCSPSVAIGASLEVRNFGPPGGTFELWFSPVTTFLPLPPFGTLLIGPAPAWKLLANIPYPPAGVHLASFAIPSEPSLHGTPLHFQSVAVTSFAPLVIELTNRASSLVQ